MKIYHFTKEVRDGFKEFQLEIKSYNGIVCFDFEDSIEEEQECGILSEKNSHRNSVLNSLKQLKSEIPLSEAGFRINKLHSPSYCADVDAINSLNQVACIFVPKIESADGLNTVLDDILIQTEIIPIIETITGYDNLAEILSVNDKRIQQVAFGHCDFNKSMGNFPFFHQDSKEYWEWINYFDQECSRFKRGFINSPVLDLANDSLFKDTLNHCLNYRSFNGQVTLCKRQAIISSNFHGPYYNEAQNSKSFRPSSAYELIKQYEKYKITDRTFAINEHRVLISPQEYLSAIKNSLLS